jgi:N-acetylglutamate synthase-like GNAT family acetyltransferase
MPKNSFVLPQIASLSFTSTALREGSLEFVLVTRFIDTVVDEPVAGQNLLRFDPRLTQNPSARLTVLVVDHDIAGCVATWLDGEGIHGWLGSLAVGPTYRGRGLATRLINNAVHDRRDVDRRVVPLFATVRVLPNGQLNWGSYAALRKAGFIAAEFLRPKVKSFGQRGNHLWATAEMDGTVRQVLAVRITPVQLPEFPQ